MVLSFGISYQYHQCPDGSILVISNMLPNFL